MSVTQNTFDANATPAPGTNPEYDLNQAQLDEAEAGNEGGFAQNILNGPLSNTIQQAQHVAMQGRDAVVNAGKGILEMGGSVFSGLKRGFSKTGPEAGGE